mgnify:CR=1 FL=1
MNRIASGINEFMIHGKILPVVFMITVLLASVNVASGKSFGNTSPPDTAKTQYDINDPRNPNCPCHKQQQQADDEYEQMKQQQNPQQNPQVQVSVSNNPNTDNVNQNNTQTESGQTDRDNSRSSGVTKSHRKEISAKLLRRKLIKLSWRISKRKTGTKKFGSHLTDCFHWG